ncbi:S8 family serine peptidase [Streptomyces glaucosporus]
MARADDVRSQQWYLDAMRAEEMWKVSTGEGIKVAVVDSGVDASTGALRGQVLPGEDMTGVAGGATGDYTGHGTAIAEIIAGTGKNGSVRGLAPGAKVIPCRIPLKGLGSEIKADGYVKAIRTAADSDAEIVNMSFGGPSYDSEGTKAVEYALSKGKLLFAGVGNGAEKGNERQYPASYTGVVGVGATDRRGKVAGFSQHGLNVDLSAPGDEMPSWCDETFRKYCVRDGGTGSATAIASASAALTWSKHPDWTADQVLRVLVDTAGRRDASSVHIGYGAVRPRIHLLEGEGGPGNPDVNPIEATEPTPSPSASSPEGKSGAENENGTAGERVGKASSESGNSNHPWVYLGAGAAVAAVAAGAFALVRRARRT